MASISITDPSTNNVACPDPLHGGYSLQGFALQPPPLLDSDGENDPPPSPQPPPPPVGVPVITITFKKESDSTTKDYTATVTPDTNMGMTLPTGVWQLAKPTDLVTGETYTVTAKLGTAQTPRTGIGA